MSEKDEIIKELLARLEDATQLVDEYSGETSEREVCNDCERVVADARATMKRARAALTKEPGHG